MSTSYQITLRCTDCGHKFKRMVATVDADDPPCPRCAKQRQNIGLDVAAGVAPSIGGNLSVKAMDFTMETVAAEYGMTDLSTDAREGAAMAPKLPPAQQAAADAMFNPTLRKKAMNANGGGAMGARLGAIQANALAGSYAVPADNPIAALHAQHQRGAKIKANIVAG